LSEFAALARRIDGIEGFWDDLGGTFEGVRIEDATKLSLPRNPARLLSILKIVPTRSPTMLELPLELALVLRARFQA